MLIYVGFFNVTICDNRYDKIWKTREYFQNINITVFFFIKSTSLYCFSKTPLYIYTTLIVEFMCLYLQNQIKR